MPPPIRGEHAIRIGQDQTLQQPVAAILLHLQFQFAKLLALVFELVHNQFQLRGITTRNRNRRLHGCRLGLSTLDSCQCQIFQVYGQFSLVLWLPHRPATDIVRGYSGAQLPTTGIRCNMQVMYRLAITADFLNLQPGPAYGGYITMSARHADQSSPSFQRYVRDGADQPDAVAVHLTAAVAEIYRTAPDFP